MTKLTAAVLETTKQGTNVTQTETVTRAGTTSGTLLVPLSKGTTAGEAASVPQLWSEVSHNGPEATVSKSRSPNRMESQSERHSVACISAVGYEPDRSGTCN